MTKIRSEEFCKRLHGVYIMSQLLLVAPGELMVVRDPLVSLRTYLGCCVGVALYDHAASVGGLIHIILPDSRSGMADSAPARYARTGIPSLLREMEGAGGDRRRFSGWIAGGAQVIPDRQGHVDLDIGGRNVHAVSGLLKAEGIPVVARDVGGNFGRILTFHMDRGTAEFAPIRSIDEGAGRAANNSIPDRPELTRAIQGLLPAVSAGIAARLFALIEDDRAAIRDLKEEIYKDESLTANVLRLCNSAYFGLRRRIADLSQAVVLLGTGNVKKIILTALVRPIYEARTNNYFLRKRDLFQHALGCALGAELLARNTGYPDPEHAFVAGLLHDMGKVVLGQYAPGQFNQAIEMVSDGKSTFEEAEQEVLGYDHAQVGGWVAEAWHLPPLLSEAISHHHRPMDATVSQTTTALVHVADTICNILGLGCGRGGLAHRIDAGALSLISLGTGEIEDTISALPEMVRKVQEADA